MNPPAINWPAFHKVAAVVGWTILAALIWRDVTGTLPMCQQHSPLTREQLHEKYGLERN